MKPCTGVVGYSNCTPKGSVEKNSRDFGRSAFAIATGFEVGFGFASPNCLADIEIDSWVAFGNCIDSLDYKA